MASELSLLDFLIVATRNKWKLLANFVAVSVIAVTISLLLPKFYRSSVVFIPQGPSGSGLVSLIGKNLGGDILGGSKLSKRQYIALLDSRELRERVIEEFNLIEIYENTDRPNPKDQTLEDLSKAVEIEELEEGGLGITDVISITVSVIDKEPARAAAMANFMYREMERRSIELHSSEYEEIRSFLNRQMAICEDKLAAARTQLKEFQIRNKAYDIPQQVSMTLKAIGYHKAEMAALQKEKAYLQRTHTNGFAGINILDQKIGALSNQVSRLEKTQRKDVLPGLAESIGLSNDFVDRLLEVETYVQLRVLLRQQLEQAKVKEQKDYSGLYLVDKARPAEYKCKPKRSLVVLAIVIPYMGLLIIWLLLRNYYRDLRHNHPHKLRKFDRIVENLRSR